MPTKRDQVAAALRAAITSGALAPGDKLPSETELGLNHQVSIATVRAAIANLVSEGYIRTEHGRGSFVRDRDILIRTPQGETLEGSRVQSRVYVEFANVDIAEALGGLATGVEILVCEELLSVDDQPTQLVMSRFPRTITKKIGVEQNNISSNGILTELEHKGHTVSHITERVRARLVTRDEASALDLPIGSPCLHIVRTVTSETGRVLSVSDMTLVDRYESVYETPAQ